MLEYEATGLYVLAGRCIFTLSLCHIFPSTGLDRGVENWCFFTLWIRISALNWILARGSATKICWSFVDCASCNLGKKAHFGWVIIGDFAVSCHNQDRRLVTFTGIKLY